MYGVVCFTLFFFFCLCEYATRMPLQQLWLRISCLEFHSLKQLWSTRQGATSCCLLFDCKLYSGSGGENWTVACCAAAFQYWCFIFVHLIWHNCPLKVTKKNFWCKQHWGDTMRHIGTCNGIFDIPRFHFHGHLVHKLLKLIWRQHILCFCVNAVAFTCSSVSGFNFWSLCCAFSAFCRMKAEKKKFPQSAFQGPALWKIHSLFAVLLLTDVSVSASTWISCRWHGLGSESVSVYEKAHVRWRRENFFFFTSSKASHHIHLYLPCPPLAQRTVLSWAPDPLFCQRCWLH